MEEELSEFLNKPFLFDKVGRVIIKKDQVLRVITDEGYIKLYKTLIKSEDFRDMFPLGLIETSIYSETENVLILRHEKIDFILHPSEYTNKMFWEAAVMYIILCKEMYKRYGILTVDAHPWNITFNGPNPVFFDFSSFYKGNMISLGWLKEFEKYFAIPIRLARISKKTFPLSQEYRREHINGFGLSLLNKPIIRKIFNRRYNSIYKGNSNPEEVYENILKWLNKNKPIEEKSEYWLEYEQSHQANFLNPITLKQKFVFDILSGRKPTKVLDLAANKGYFAMMAEKIGAKVLAFDYEEMTVNTCRGEILKNKGGVTPAMKNFIYPSPPSGPGLTTKSSYERFTCEIVLALGLIHHICLRQGIPVSVFCEICKNYAEKGIILEFVDPTDIHVQTWKIQIPIDYTKESIYDYMYDKFPKIEEKIHVEDGINRTFIYFFN